MDYDKRRIIKKQGILFGSIQNDLFRVMENYMKSKGITQTELAQELNVTKSYISQILNGNFDHKITKLVELSLACGMVPIVRFEPLEKFIDEDLKGYNLYYNAAHPTHGTKKE